MSADCPNPAPNAQVDYPGGNPGTPANVGVLCCPECGAALRLASCGPETNAPHKLSSALPAVPELPSALTTPIAFSPSYPATTQPLGLQALAAPLAAMPPGVRGLPATTLPPLAPPKPPIVAHGIVAAPQHRALDPMTAPDMNDHADATETTETSAEWANEEWDEPTRVHRGPDSQPESHSEQQHGASRSDAIASDTGTTPTPAFFGSAIATTESQSDQRFVERPDDSVEDIDAFLESAPHLEPQPADKRRKRPRPPSPSDHRIETRNAGAAKLRASQTTLIGINGPNMESGIAAPLDVPEPPTMVPETTSEVALLQVPPPPDTALRDAALSDAALRDQLANATANMAPGIAPAPVTVASNDPETASNPHAAVAAREGLSDAPTT
ncbi:MAG TPA: hypothetical protein VIV60_31430, partial [Polyangiaceae bacterium]